MYILIYAVHVCVNDYVSPVAVRTNEITRGPHRLAQKQRRGVLVYASVSLLTAHTYNTVTPTLQ